MSLGIERFNLQVCLQAKMGYNREASCAFGNPMIELKLKLDFAR